MQWIALYILLCGVGYLVLPWMLRVVKRVQRDPPVPLIGESDHEIYCRTRLPECANTGDFNCDECGHDKWAEHSPAFSWASYPKCVRCGHRHLPNGR